MKTYICDSCGRISTTTQDNERCYWCGNATQVSSEDAVEVPIPKSQVGTDYIAVVYRGKVVDTLLLSDRTSVAYLGNELVSHLQEYVNRVGRGESCTDGRNSSQSNSDEAASVTRILVVDHDENIRKIIVSMLVAGDYVCREAARSREVLSLLEYGENFDLMLEEVMMPDIDGIGLMERTKERLPDMPVVMVTSVHDVDVALHAIRCGAFDYMMKPFERKQLLATVRRALEYRRFRLEHRAYVSSLESQVATLSKKWDVKKS